MTISRRGWTVAASICRRKCSPCCACLQNSALNGIPVLRKESIEEQTGRPANEIVRDLRKALISCGLTRAEAGTIVTTVRSYGYRLGLVGSEVAIDA